MKNVANVLAVFIILVPLLSVVTAQEPRRMALVIGNSEYLRKSKLPNAVNDAESIAATLKQVGFTVTTKLNRNSKNQMRRDIDDFVASLHKNDACFVFYAGHGLSFNNANYLVPVDAELRLAHHVEANCLEVKYIKDALRYSNAGLKVIILDACRSEEVLPVRFRGGIKGMVREPVYDGMIIAFSTAPGEVALDGIGNNSPYTKHLVRTINQQYSDGLTLRDCFIRTARAVREETGQRPYRESDDTLDDFFLKRTGDPERKLVDKTSLINSIGMKFRLISSGRFEMGSPVSEKGRNDDELQHGVEISKSFYIGIFEVTRGQFASFVTDSNYKTEPEKDGDGGHGWNAESKKFEGRDPKYSWRSTGLELSDTDPVVNVTWNDAESFCRWLSEKEGKHYRLPTEAEWEFACRAGSRSSFHFGGDPEMLAQYGNVADRSAKSKFGSKYTIKADDGNEFGSEIGNYAPNKFGLFDMHGNVWEWCADRYDHDYYASSPLRDPAGPATGSSRVARGGAWTGTFWNCRSANRLKRSPTARGFALGFRVLLTN